MIHRFPPFITGLNMKNRGNIDILLKGQWSGNGFLYIFTFQHLKVWTWPVQYFTKDFNGKFMLSRKNIFIIIRLHVYMLQPNLDGAIVFHSCISTVVCLRIEFQLDWSFCGCPAKLVKTPHAYYICIYKQSRPLIHHSAVLGTHL